MDMRVVIPYSDNLSLSHSSGLDARLPKATAELGSLQRG
jgi:hypothetical protein